MLGMPEPTAYDLRFRFLGIPVRVHPLFWLFSALLVMDQDAGLMSVLIWIGCVFVSILVHEYGHGLMSRAFRCSPSIVLYAMGGLCYSEAERQTPWQRLAVLIAGPGAGLLFYALIQGGLMLGPPPVNRVGVEILWNLLEINLTWSLLNLLPIWPLDGGQISGVVLSMINRRKGMNWTHVLSLVTAGIIAMVFFRYSRMLTGLFFAFFALINFQVLQAQHHAARYSNLEDDADWWKR
jgi:Zn-dependent protease